MYGPIAWLDGLLALILFPLGLVVLAYLFRNDKATESHTQS